MLATEDWRPLCVFAFYSPSRWDSAPALENCQAEKNRRNWASYMWKKRAIREVFVDYAGSGCTDPRGIVR
jgi:hypothetical protein